VGTIDNIMKILHVTKMGPHLTTIEEIYIYKKTQKENQLINTQLVLMQYLMSSLRT
jgi:hypothetical protein